MYRVVRSAFIPVTRAARRDTVLIDNPAVRVVTTHVAPRVIGFTILPIESSGLYPVPFNGKQPPIKIAPAIRIGLILFIEISIIKLD